MTLTRRFPPHRWLARNHYSVQTTIHSSIVFCYSTQEGHRFGTEKLVVLSLLLVPTALALPHLSSIPLSVIPPPFHLPIPALIGLDPTDPIELSSTQSRNPKREPRHHRRYISYMLCTPLQSTCIRFVHWYHRKLRKSPKSFLVGFCHTTRDQLFPSRKKS